MTYFAANTNWDFCLYLESSSVVQRKCNVTENASSHWVDSSRPREFSWSLRRNIICLRWKCLSKIKYRTPFNNEMLNRCQNGQMCSCNSILNGNIWPYGQNQRNVFLISNHVIGLHTGGQCRRLSIFAAPKCQNSRSSVRFSVRNPKKNISNYLKLPPPG